MSKAFQHFTDIPMMVTGMMLFLSVFLGVTIQVLWRGSKAYTQLEKLPFEGEESV